MSLCNTQGVGSSFSSAGSPHTSHCATCTFSPVCEHPTQNTGKSHLGGCATCSVGQTLMKTQKQHSFAIENRIDIPTRESPYPQIRQCVCAAPNANQCGVSPTDACTPSHILHHPLLQAMDSLHHTCPPCQPSKQL